ncbi:hypothetical protein GGH99_000377 [Coemansia sp. RSA 1285]|nr:hypothetical protein GGH99_000377 [Coemansia sp. RSA 1285]
MNSNDIPSTLRRIIDLGRAKSYAELGRLLAAQDEGALYGLVEADVGAASRAEGTGDGGAVATQHMFKAAGALIEGGTVAAGQRALGTVAAACVAQICEDNVAEEEEEEEEDGGCRWAAVCDRLLESLPQQSPRAVIDVSFRILAELKTSGSAPAALLRHGVLPMLLDTLGAIGQIELVVASAHALAAASSQDNPVGDQTAASSSVLRSGSSLKAYWVDSACAYRWDPRASAALCALLREIVLDERQTRVVARRMLRQLRSADYAELPAMVYQLLLLARKGHKREIIAGVFAVFDALEKRERAQPAASDRQERNSSRGRELGDIEGTVLLHINYSIKQDYELSSALIAYGREQSGLAHGVSAFLFACLLSLARIHRFEKDAAELLRSAVLRSIGDRVALETTCWARPCVARIAFDAHRLLGATVARASYGWDQVTQALVALCFGLLDTAHAAAKRPPGASRSGSHEALAETQELCVATLHRAFRAHPFVRGEIVDQIVVRVVFQEEAQARCTDLLRRLAAADDCEEAFRPLHAKLVSAFDAIAAIPPDAAERLVAAAAPAIVADAQLRSALLLVLRKILFTHSVEGRRTALGALFVLARCFATELSRSGRRAREAAGSRAAGLRADAAMSVLLEVLGLVRRCLVQQQPEVRALAYSRLAQLLDDPEVAASQFVLRALCGVVQPEFAKYYDASRAHDSPIAVTQCVSPASARVVVPVAALLRCAAKLAHGMMALAASAERDGADAPSGAGGVSSGPTLQQSAHAIWTDICARLAATRLEDFELDPAGSYALDDPAGLRNHNTALLVAGCLDAALEYALMHCVGGSGGSCGCEPSDPNTAMKLFAKFVRVGDVLCSLCVDERKRRVVALPSELSAMSLGRAAHVLQLVLPDRRRLRSERHPADARDPGGCRPGHAGAVRKAALWSANQAFVRHLLEVALARVLRRPPFAGHAANHNQMSAPDADLVLRVACAVYGGVLAHYAGGADAADSDEQLLPACLRPRGTARGRSVLQLSAELLLACANALLAAGDGGGALGRMALAVLAPDPPVDSPTEEEEIEAAARLLSALRTVVTSFLAQRPAAVRESVHIVTLMTLLAARLTRLAVGMPPADESATRARTAVYRSISSAVGWALRVCFGDMPEDAGLLKALFALLTTCQPFLQPMDTLFSPAAAAVALGSMSRGHMPDLDEFAPVGQIVGTVRSASRILLDDALSDAEDDDGGGGGDPNLDVYTLRTLPPLIAAITAWFKQELHRIEWACHQLGRCAAIEKMRQQQQQQQEEGDGDGGLDQSTTTTTTTTTTAEIFERRICLRIQAVAQMLDQLLSIHFGPRISGDLVIRALNDLHRCFLLLTKTKLACPDLPVTAEYVDTLALLCQSLNTRAYAMFLDKYTGAAESLGSTFSSSSTTTGDAKGMLSGAGKGDGAKGKEKKKSLTARAGSAKSKVLRDSALVSSLVFQIEQTEKHVILLSSRFKVPLAHYLKRSTARDFRIEAAAIPSPVSVSHHYGVQPGESMPQDCGAQPHEEEEEEEERAVLAENSDEETEILVEMDDSEGVAGIGDDDTGIRSEHSVDPVGYLQQTKRPRLHHR